MGEMTVSSVLRVKEKKIREEEGGREKKRKSSDFSPSLSLFTCDLYSYRLLLTNAMKSLMFSIFSTHMRVGKYYLSSLNSLGSDQN